MYMQGVRWELGVVFGCHLNLGLLHMQDRIAGEQIVKR